MHTTFLKINVIKKGNIGAPIENLLLSTRMFCSTSRHVTRLAQCVIIHVIGLGNSMNNAVVRPLKSTLRTINNERLSLK